MKNHDEPVQIEDPPQPPLTELQQRDLPFPAVAVRVDGSTLTRSQPALQGPVISVKVTTTPEQVMGPDPKRSRAVLVADTAWFYMNRVNGQTAPIPANVPITICHAGEVWCKRQSADGNLGAITEYYAD